MRNHKMLLGSTSFYRMRDQGQAGAGGGGGNAGGVGTSSAGTGEQAGAGNNGGGNGDTGAANNGGNQNNSSSSFDPSKFWADPNGGNNSGGGNQGGVNHEEAGKAFAAKLAGINYGDAFNGDIMKQMAEGDIKGANDSFRGLLQNATQQSVMLTAELMQKNNDAMLDRVSKLLDDRLGGRDNDAALAENFPMAKDPALKPMVKGIFDQAMKLSKGDRAQAIESTKQMLKYMGTAGAADLGINNPPSSGSDNYTSAAATSLIDELLGR